MKFKTKKDKIISSSIAVCIVSGGIDSVCTAAYLKKQNFDLYIITFRYGQRANLEIEYAKKFAKYLDSKQHKIVDISFMKDIYGETNILTDDKQKIPKNFRYNIIAPIRNAIFITIATAWAMNIGAKIIAYGAHTGDNNYPDCRPEFTKLISKTLNLGDIDGIRLGLRKKINVWSPAIDGLDKSELIRIGYEIIGDKIFETWSCYSNGIDTKDSKKIHCGICESCINRRRAFRKVNIDDKTEYANQ
jgi:7-cyano-7-deazaguanine synthase